MNKNWIQNMSSGGSDYNSPNYWKTSISHAIQLRDTYSSISRWGDIEDYWNHNFPAGDPVFNLVYMFGRALIPTLMYKNPVVINTPKYPKNIPMASMMDSVDEWLIQEMELEDVMKKAILYAFLYNMAPIETGFDFPVGVEGDDPEERFKNAFLANMGVLDSGGQGSANRSRRQNFPWLDIIYPRKIIFEPTTRDMRTCRWYAKSIYTPTRLLKKDPMIDQSKLKGTHIPVEMLDDNTRDMYDKIAGIEEYSHFYEIHNQETKEMLIMQGDGQILMDKIPDPMQFDGLPLDTLTFNQNPLSIWGTPDSLYIEPMMLEGNELRSLGIKQARASLLKFIINQENMDDTELEKIFTDDVVCLKAKNIPPNSEGMGNVIMPLSPSAKMEFEIKQNALISDAQRVLGFGTNQMGGFNSGRRTAKEADIVQWNNQMRTDERRWLVAKTITGVMRKVNQAVLKYWQEPILVRVLGVEGAMYWVKMRPQDVKAEMDVKVDVESLAPPSKERTKDDIMQLIQILSQAPDANIQPLLRRLLSKFPEVDAAEIFPVAQNQEVSAAGFTDSQNQQLYDPNKARASAVDAATRLANLA